MTCECPGFWRINGEMVTCQGCEETRIRYNYDVGAPCQFTIGNKASNENPPRPLCKFCWQKCPGWHLKPERRTPDAFLQQPPWAAVAAMQQPPGAAVAVPGLSTSAERQPWGSLQQQPLGPPPPAGTPSPGLTGNRSPTPGSERSGASSQPLAPPPPNAVVELLVQRMESLCSKQERLGTVFEDLYCQLKQITEALGAAIPSQEPLVSGAALLDPRPHLNNGIQSQAAPPGLPQGALPTPPLDRPPPAQPGNQ